MKDVIIDIKGTQGIDGEEEVIELSTIGKLSERGGKFLITYEDSESFKPNKVKTMLKIEGNDKATMIRSGAIESRMVIEKGRRNTCFYSIPQGEIVLGIFAQNIINTLNAHGGEVKMSYNIDLDNSLLSRNTVEISIKEVKKDVTNS